MARSRDQIKVNIDGDITGFRKAVNTATLQVDMFSRKVKESLTTIGGRQFDGIRTGFSNIGAAAALAATGGIYLFTQALGNAIAKSSDFETASFNLSKSIEAANRQFNIGSAQDWEGHIEELGRRLKIYSETELREAASKTIDMTKRLGLSAEQMVKVTEIAGDLGAGKFDLVDATERITAALRGEAEASEALGLTLNEDYVRGWYEASNATGKAWKDLTDLEKAQIRYQVLLEQSDPSLGKAADSLETYAGSMKATKNAYGDLQKEAGNLVTQNTFVIESLAVLRDLFATWKDSIVANRDELVKLVKTGILALITGIEGAIEAIRFFYNGWQGLKLVAHGVVLLIIKGFQLILDSMSPVLDSLELVFDGMEKIGLIDSNPLRRFREELDGFEQFSTDQFNEMLDGISDTNEKFDEAKRIVGDFKKQIQDIPAEYKDSTKEMADDTEAVETEVVKVGDEWVTVYKNAEKASDAATRKMIENARKVAREVQSSAEGRQAGGPVGYARGGNPFFGGLAGYGGGDRRLILVEDGEHVIRKEGVARFGHAFFQRFNDLGFLANLPRFAAGGSVAAAPPAPAPAGEVVTINLQINGGRRYGPLSGSRADVSGLLRDLRLAQEGSS